MANKVKISSYSQESHTSSQAVFKEKSPSNERIHHILTEPSLKM